MRSYLSLSHLISLNLSCCIFWYQEKWNVSRHVPTPKLLGSALDSFWFGFEMWIISYAKYFSFSKIELGWVMKSNLRVEQKVAMHWLMWKKFINWANWNSISPISLSLLPPQIHWSSFLFYWIYSFFCGIYYSFIILSYKHLIFDYLL
jgi:hypothetical protein